MKFNVLILSILIGFNINASVESMRILNNSAQSLCVDFIVPDHCRVDIAITKFNIPNALFTTTLNKSMTRSRQIYSGVNSWHEADILAMQLKIEEVMLKSAIKIGEISKAAMRDVLDRVNISAIKLFIKRNASSIIKYMGYYTKLCAYNLYQMID